MIDLNSFRRIIDGIPGNAAIIAKAQLLDLENELRLGNEARLELARRDRGAAEPMQMTG